MQDPTATDTATPGARVFLHPAFTPSAELDRAFWLLLGLAEDEQETRGETDHLETLLAACGGLLISSAKAADIEEAAAASRG